MLSLNNHNEIAKFLTFKEIRRLKDINDSYLHIYNRIKLKETVKILEDIYSKYRYPLHNLVYFKSKKILLKDASQKEINKFKRLKALKAKNTNIISDFTYLSYVDTNLNTYKFNNVSYSDFSDNISDVIDYLIIDRGNIKEEFNLIIINQYEHALDVIHIKKQITVKNLFFKNFPILTHLRGNGKLFFFPCNINNSSERYNVYHHSFKNESIRIYCVAKHIYEKIDFSNTYLRYKNYIFDNYKVYNIEYPFEDYKNKYLSGKNELSFNEYTRIINESIII